MVVEDVRKLIVMVLSISDELKKSEREHLMRIISVRGEFKSKKQTPTKLPELLKVVHDIRKKDALYIYKLLISHNVYPLCAWCNEPIKFVGDFSFDHIIAKANGGSPRLVNMQPMHRSCNLVKGCRDIDCNCKYEFVVVKTVTIELEYFYIPKNNYDEFKLPELPFVKSVKGSHNNQR